MLWQFVVMGVRQAFKETEFLDYVAGAIADRIRSSAAVHSAVAEINKQIDRIDGMINDNSPKVYFARRLVVSQIQELAAENSDLARAIAVGDDYFHAVLDGLSVDEVLTASIPLKDLIAQRAWEVARRLG